MNCKAFGDIRQNKFDISTNFKSLLLFGGNDCLMASTKLIDSQYRVERSAMATLLGAYFECFIFDKDMLRNI